MVDSSRCSSVKGMVFDNVAKEVPDLVRIDQGVVQLITKKQTLVEDKNQGFTCGWHSDSCGTSAHRDVGHSFIAVSKRSDRAVVLGLRYGDKVGSTAGSISMIVHFTGGDNSSWVVAT